MKPSDSRLFSVGGFRLLIQSPYLLLFYSLFIFSIVFLWSNSFIYALIFVISFFLLSLGLDCSSFPSALRCKARLFICHLSCFLIFIFIAVNFPYKLLSWHSTGFGMLCFHFYLLQDIFIFLLISSLNYCLFRIVLYLFTIFVNFLAFLLLIFSFISLVREYTWYNFNLLKFLRLFVTYNMIYVENAPCALEENVYSTALDGMFSIYLLDLLISSIVQV